MLSQNCSSPARQLGQMPHESTMQPTAAISPSLNFFTSLPTFTTRPTISCPGTQGYAVGMKLFHSSRVWCKSEWQTPQKRISICTSCGCGARRVKLYGESGEVALVAAKAFV